MFCKPGAQLFGVLTLALALLVLSSCSSESHGRRTIFNDDGQVIAEAPAEDPVPFVKAWLDRESEFVPFTTFVFLAATPDICLYNTKVGEQYGDRFGENFDDSYTPAMRQLKKAGTDPLELVTEHMKAKGFEVIAAVRMNDTHHRTLDPGNPLCSMFAIEHPEYVIKQPDGRTNETALDYSYPEVREHRFAIMREIAEEYNVDGLELNFVRWAKHFPRDKGREKAFIMTEFIGQIRAMMNEAAKKRGVDRLTLGVRVPESIEACWLAGLDIKTWVEKGWIDYIVLATWNNTDPQLPVDQFMTFTKPAGVETLVLMGNMIGAIWSGPPVIFNRGIAMSEKQKTRGYLGMLITEAEARAAAANYYAWGADGISFWNVGIHFGSEETAKPEQRDRIKRWTSVVCDPEHVYDERRWYHYLPMGKGIGTRKPPHRNYPWYDEGKSPLGHPNSPVLTFGIEKQGERLVFPFRMADGRNGESLSGSLEFNIYHATVTDSFIVDINGTKVGAKNVSRTSVDPRAELPGVRFTIDLAKCPKFQGDNELGLTLTTVSRKEPVPYMEELEVFVE